MNAPAWRRVARVACHVAVSVLVTVAVLFALAWLVTR